MTKQILSKTKALIFILLISISSAFATDYAGEFHVGGTSASYYPVLFSVTGVHGVSSLGKLSVCIPDVHQNGDWTGSFHSDFEFISSNWGHTPTKIVSFTYIPGSGTIYNDPIADFADGSTGGGGSQLVVWLKGGANYNWSSSNNSIVELMDGNAGGTVKTNASGVQLPIKTEQAALVYVSKNNRLHHSVGLVSTSKGLFGGDVGIGTFEPKTKLEVFNTAQAGHLTLSADDNEAADMTRIDLDYKVANQNHVIGRISSAYLTSANGGAGALRFYTRNNGDLGEKMRINHEGYVGIGTTNPLTKFDVKTAPNQHIQITHDVNGALPGCVGIVSINDGNTAYTPMGFYASKYYFGNGNIGIGTTTPDQMLTVNGTIHAKEVLVDMDILADYVFNSDYSLMPLHKVEAFVKTNKHLPEIPSAAEVKEKGLSMGEMQNKLLQKIEELTLYVIELQKTNEKQSAKIEELEIKIK